MSDIARKDTFRSKIAGYVAADGNESKPTSRFAALWVQKTGDDDSRLVVASSAAELTKLQGQLKNDGLVPLTLHAWRQSKDELSYSGVWHKLATGTAATASSQSGLSEGSIPGVVAEQSGSLIDLDLTCGTSAAQARRSVPHRRCKQRKLPSRLIRMISHLGSLGRRLTWISARARRRLTTSMSSSISPRSELQAYQFRAIAHARLGHKDQARADREKFEKGDATESHKLYLAVIVAAELGDGTDRAIEALEASLKQQPQDSDLHYNAACAYALASQALARKDQAKGREFAERAIHLLRKAIENGYSDYKHMQEDSDLDPLRELPAFAEILHSDRSYAAVWAGDLRFEASPLFGLDPTTHLQRCRELASQGYRMVSISVARTSPEGSPVTASVWHRPVITEEVEGPTGETSSSGGNRSPSDGQSGRGHAPAAPQCRSPAS